MKKLSLVMLFVAIMAAQMFAQPGQGMRQGQGQLGNRGMGQGMQPGQIMCDRLNLSTEQQKQMKELRLKMEKEMLPLRADMMKVKGELRILKAEEKPVLKSINSKIDVITSLKSKIMKLRAKHHLEIRSILTEEQRLIWEQHQFYKKGRKGHKGHGKKGFGGRYR